jgi:hypothetical protein
MIQGGPVSEKLLNYKTTKILKEFKKKFFMAALKCQSRYSSLDSVSQNDSQIDNIGGSEENS